jgi:hypothetical protein
MITKKTDYKIYHSGSFDEQNIDQVLKLEAEFCDYFGFNPQVSKRLYAIMEECLTNLNKHADNSLTGINHHKEHVSYFSVEQEDDLILINLGNTAKKEDKEKFQRALDFINHSDDIAIKKLYKARLNERVLSEKNGANLGLITIGKLASAIDYHFIHIEKDLYYLTMKITIDLLK